MSNVAIVVDPSDPEEVQVHMLGSSSFSAVPLPQYIVHILVVGHCNTDVHGTIYCVSTMAECC